MLWEGSEGQFIGSMSCRGSFAQRPDEPHQHRVMFSTQQFEIDDIMEHIRRSSLFAVNLSGFSQLLELLRLRVRGRFAAARTTCNKDYRQINSILIITS